MLHFGITSLCSCGDQGVIQVKQPAILQKVWECIGLISELRYRHLGIFIRFGAFPKTPRTLLGDLGGRCKGLAGARGLSGKLHMAPGKLLGRFRTL